MPVWVVNALNTIVRDFIWEGKGVKIAHKTLVGRSWEGGLNLMDLEVKRTAMRFKTVQSYMVGRWNYGWKEFLRSYIEAVGGMGESGWYMGFKQSMTGGIPEIYREVLEAWRKFLPKMQYECTDLQSFVNLPLFLNEYFKYAGKTVYEPAFFKGGIRQVKDIMYEVIPGFLRGNCVYDAVREVEGMERREKVNGIYEKLKSSIPAEWVNKIQTECVVKGGGQMPDLFVMEHGEKCCLDDMSVKKVYGWLIVDGLKEPASEKVWNRVFVGMDVKKIWSNVNVKYNSIECENNDFLLKHNRIYTNVVFHQINNEVSAMCDVCRRGHESFLHYFLDCDDLFDFFVYLKQLLRDNWSVELDLEDGWRQLFLFGLFQKSKTVNLCLINYVLSHARLAVVFRRNQAHFEGRKAEVKEIFKSLLKRDVELVCLYGDNVVRIFL